MIPLTVSASKRPRPFGPGYPALGISDRSRSKGFKEAQAFWPRIPYLGDSRHGVAFRASKRPRPFGPGYPEMQAFSQTFFERFKEAQAFWPRIPMINLHRLRRDLPLQRGPGLLAQDTLNSTMNNLVSMIASKRPRPFGPGYTAPGTANNINT